ncbi:MAG: hypothetical protein OXI67_19465 [Candidatus Poribacteria bacterium]|nr:hypothetical protein [Candidatus Poribacteria bacterium]
MFRKNIHFLYGGGIVILLIAAVIIFNRYQNLQTHELVKVYKGTVSSQQVPETVKQTTSPEVTTQPETVDIEEVSDAEVEESSVVSEELAPEPDETAEPVEELLTTAAGSPQEDPKVVLLKEVFSEFDRLLSETQKLMEDFQGGITPENYPELEARGKALEADLQEYCQRITEKFTGAVTFVTFEGYEGAYDVDFQVLQDSLDGPVPAELEGYFQHANLREMLGLPDIPPELLDQMQPTRR